jgi:hypothetical protein
MNGYLETKYKVVQREDEWRNGYLYDVYKKNLFGYWSYKTTTKTLDQAKDYIKPPKIEEIEYNTWYYDKEGYPVN